MSATRTIRLLAIAWIAHLFSLFAPISGEAAVWETSRQWSPRVERHYQQWVAENWNKNFFNEPGPFQGIKVDCADTVYGMRLAYASTYGLPFAIKDPTGGGGVITNEMTRFDKYPAEERLRRFMLFINNVVSTSSIPSDTYPAAVNRDSIASGSLILTGKTNHHSWTVRYISETGIPFLLFSSRPAKTTLFERYEYPTREFIFVDGFKPETHAGFRNFRQPHEIGIPVHMVEGYSLEQYELSFKSWANQMQKRLKLSDETPEQRAERVVGEACRGARERIQFVNEALQYMAKIGGRCMNAQEYDDYSTPSRDRRLKGNFEEVLKVYKNDYKKLGKEWRSFMDSFVKGKGSSSYCGIEISQGRVLSLAQVYARSMSDRLSSDPHDSLEARWGLAPAGGYARQCGLN